MSNETPRTDAVARKGRLFHEGWYTKENGEWVEADFSRQLERENRELREALKPFSKLGLTELEKMRSESPIFGKWDEGGGGNIAAGDILKARAALAKAE